MVSGLLIVALCLLILLTLATTWRVATGPTLPDRLLAGDLTIALLTFLLAVIGTLGGSEYYLDAALAAALLAFTTTLFVATFVATGRVLGP
jgi:multicomponent Na+:H+ antiporter subunit F